jgi:hypothetical protein
MMAKHRAVRSVLVVLMTGLLLCAVSRDAQADVTTQSGHWEGPQQIFFSDLQFTIWVTLTVCTNVKTNVQVGGSTDTLATGQCLTSTHPFPVGLTIFVAPLSPGGKGTYTISWSRASTS